MSTNEVSLERIIEDLSPTHRAQREYYSLRCDAKWGKIAKTLSLWGIVYNVGILVAFLLYWASKQ